MTRGDRQLQVGAAAAKIVKRVSPKQYPHIRALEEDPKAMWERLEKMNEPKGLDGKPVSIPFLFLSYSFC